MIPKMLIIDDNKFARYNYTKIFEGEYEIKESSCVVEALDFLEKEDFDIVLLDMVMPNIDGLEMLKILKAKEKFQNLPIVVMSSDEDKQLAALKAGAWDFVSKSEKKDVFLARAYNVIERSNAIKYKEENQVMNAMLKTAMQYSKYVIFEWQIQKDYLFYTDNFFSVFAYHMEHEKFSKNLSEETFIFKDDISKFNLAIVDLMSNTNHKRTELRIINKDGDAIWYNFNFTGIYNENGVLVKVVFAVTDVDNYKKALADANYKASYDGLTQVYNRTSFESLVQIELAKNKFDGAFILIDVDDFKIVNDTFGHLAGDNLLIKIARKIKENFRSSDIVARLGGDEFAVYVSDIKGLDNLKIKLESLVASTELPVEIDGTIYYQYISSGVYYIDKGIETSFEEVYKYADEALYQTKRNGKNGYTIFGK